MQVVLSFIMLVLPIMICNAKNDLGIPETSWDESIIHLAPNLGVRIVFFKENDPVNTKRFTFSELPQKQQIEAYSKLNDNLKMTYDEKNNILFCWEKKLGDEPERYLEGKIVPLKTVQLIGDKVVPAPYPPILFSLPEFNLSLIHI